VIEEGDAEIVTVGAEGGGAEGALTVILVD
jgi:hypothetical protein